MSDGETTAAPPPPPPRLVPGAGQTELPAFLGRAKVGLAALLGRRRRDGPVVACPNVWAPGLGRARPSTRSPPAVVRCTRPAPRVLRSAAQPEEPGTSGRGGRSLLGPSARVPVIAHLSRQGRHRVVRFERRVAVGPTARPAPLPPGSGAASGHPRADHVPIECVAAVQVCPQSGAVLPDRAALFGRANRFVPADDMDLRIARSGTQHLLQCCRGGHVVRSRRRSPVHRGVRPDVQPHQGRVRVLPRKPTTPRRGMHWRLPACGRRRRRRRPMPTAAGTPRPHHPTQPAPTRQHAGSPASDRTSERHVRRASTPRRQVVLPARPTPRGEPRPRSAVAGARHRSPRADGRRPS